MSASQSPDDIELLALTDEQLVERMTTRSQQALAALMRRHATHLAAFAKRLVGPFATSEDIEEILSDTFLQAWEKSRLYDARRSAVRTWLTTLLIAQSLPKRRSLLRHRRREERAQQDLEAAAGVVDAAELLNNRMWLEHGLRDLEGISAIDAEVIMRRYFMHQPLPEIARQLGVPTNTARVRLFRAQQKLRKILAEGDQ